MRVLQSILSLSVAVIVAFCSVAQFHHHSRDGKMMVYNCTLFSELHHEHDNVADHVGDCGHGCHDGHHKKEKQCSIKINIVKPEKKQNLNFVFWSDVLDGMRTIYNAVKNDFESYNESVICIVKLESKFLRAPPSL